METTTTEPENAAPARRLVRRRADRKIAGVCAGLAEHFNLDPLWVRLGFVLLLFAGGLSLVAYIALWILMPVTDEPMGDVPTDAHEFSLRIGSGALPVVVMVIGLLILATPLIDDRPGLVWGVALVALGLYLFRDREERDDRSEQGASAATQVAARSGEEVSAPQGTLADAPTGPRATDGPPAPPRSRPPRRPYSPLGAITFGLLFVVIGVLWLFDSSGADIKVVHYTGTGLLILGLGLAVGTFFGRARWLIIPGVILLPFTVVSGLADVSLEGGVGERVYTPRTVADVHTPYRLGLGEIDLRLNQMQLPADGELLPIQAEIGIGTIRVAVPAGVPVDIRAEVSIGEVTIVGEQVGGTSIDVIRRLGPREGPAAIALDLRNSIGTIIVRAVRPPPAPLSPPSPPAPPGEAR